MHFFPTLTHFFQSHHSLAIASSEIALLIIFLGDPINLEYVSMNSQFYMNFLNVDLSYSLSFISSFVSFLRQNRRSYFSCKLPTIVLLFLIISLNFQIKVNSWFSILFSWSKSENNYKVCFVSSVIFYC